MTNEENEKLIKCFYSLQKSLQSAGGTLISVDSLKKMSAFELLCLVGPNDIEFTCKSEAK